MDGILAMSALERERLRVIEAVREGRLTQRAAAQRLGLSVRQVKRLCRAYRRRGAAGLVEGRTDYIRMNRWSNLRRPIRHSADLASRYRHSRPAPACRFRPVSLDPQRDSARLPSGQRFHGAGQSRSIP